jgi:hypothetical protein
MDQWNSQHLSSAQSEMIRRNFVANRVAPSALVPDIALNGRVQTYKGAEQKDLTRFPNTNATGYLQFNCTSRLRANILEILSTMYFALVLVRKRHGRPARTRG